MLKTQRLTNTIHSMPNYPFLATGFLPYHLSLAFLYPSFIHIAFLFLTLQFVEYWRTLDNTRQRSALQLPHY